MQGPKQEAASIKPVINVDQVQQKVVLVLNQASLPLNPPTIRQPVVVNRFSIENPGRALLNTTYTFNMEEFESTARRGLASETVIEGDVVVSPLTQRGLRTVCPEKLSDEGCLLWAKAKIVRFVELITDGRDFKANVRRRLLHKLRR